MTDDNSSNDLNFEILEHKADLRIRAFGKTKEDLFSNMLQGMQESMKPEVKNEEQTIRKINVKSPDLPSLLIDFLSEALYLSQVNKEVYFEAKFKKFSDRELEIDLIGQKVERFGEDIKAVTYHNLEIDQGESGLWQATILFDI